MEKGWGRERQTHRKTGMASNSLNPQIIFTASLFLAELCIFCISCRGPKSRSSSENPQSLRAARPARRKAKPVKWFPRATLKGMAGAQDTELRSVSTSCLGGELESANKIVSLKELRFLNKAINNFTNGACTV